jgi:cell division protein FtsL
MIGTTIRTFICIFVAGLTFYAYIDKQNELVELRMAIPSLAKEVKTLEEENTRLKYEIERFESPIHLMELARKPEFSHLKYPYNHEILILPSNHE